MAEAASAAVTAGAGADVRAGALDPGVRTFMESVNRAYAAHPDLARMPLARRREIAEAIRVPWRTGGPAMARTRDLATDTGVGLRLHRPTEADNLPVLLYVHGGGWTLFSIDTHDRLMREYAARAQVAVIGVDYSLSPEAKFPVALGEVADTIGWVRANGAALGLDAARLAVGGDSAGANLAVTAALLLRDRGEPQPAGLMLNYGVFAADPSSSYARYDGPDYFLEVAEMNAFWDNYLGDPSDVANPLVTPIHADLAGLPPTFLAIAECDILTDGNHAFAERLARADVPVEAIVYHGATHSFLEAMSVSDLASRALDDEAAFLRRVLSAGTAAA